MADYRPDSQPATESGLRNLQAAVVAAQSLREALGRCRCHWTNVESKEAIRDALSYLDAVDRCLLDIRPADPEEDRT